MLTPTPAMGVLAIGTREMFLLLLDMGTGVLDIGVLGTTNPSLDLAGELDVDIADGWVES